MSGIEIAGLVLGAIPLVISALEHYENIIGPAKAFYKYGNELSQLTQGLATQYASFEQSMLILLTPITNDAELNEMIDNTNSALWKDPDIDQALRGKLGKAYGAYTRTAQDVQRIMISIAKSLSIKGADKITQDGLEAIIEAHPPVKVDGVSHKFGFKNKIRFTMKKQQIKKSLDELQKAIDVLDKFHAKAEMLEEPYRADRRSKFVLPLYVIQQNAAKLYNVLLKTWCSTHSSHSAGLLLEQRLVKKLKRVEPGWKRKQQPTKSCDTSCFRISILQSPSPKRWLDVEFRLVEIYNSTVQVVLPYADPSQLQVVTNLCSILQHPCHPSIGFCLDSDGLLRGAYQAQQRSIAYTNDGVSLEELLVKRLGLLTQQERYTLSIILTSSLLQLSHTPWLRESWNKADIIFLRAKGAEDGAGVPVDVQHPYLTREHKLNNMALVRHDAPSWNDSSKLLALGIMLLEICYGRPIEELRKPEDLGPNNQLNEVSNLQAARRWLLEREGKGEVSFAFKSAISYCLKCFVDPTASLENDDFSRTVQEQVLAPLEEEMNFLLFGPPSR